MSDKYKLIDEPWDAEKALRERQKIYDVAQEQVKKRQPTEEQPLSTPRRSEPMQKHETMQRRDASRKPRRRKRKVNIKGWLILIGIAAACLAIVIGLISLLVGALSSEEEVPTEPTTISTQPTESTESTEEKLSKVLVRAEQLAASYDYDAAIAALSEFGADWAQQSALKEAESRFLELKSELVLWEDTTKIPHISVRALIVDTSRAFDDDADALTYQQSMLTVAEFRAILQSLYERDYVLIGMHDMVKNTAQQDGDTELEQGEIYLPEGKKPIVLSQEDVNYYQSLVDGSDEDVYADAQGDGFACQLLLDEQGELTCKYVDADGNELYGAYDMVPIVEEFVAQHPDFSYHGAKGVVAVTGVEGVFGFRTHPDWEVILGEDAYMQEIRQAQAVAAKLKENGWEIACQGYSKISFADSDADTIADNVRKWDNQVAPIVGRTEILFFPYGLDIGSVNYYSGEKFNVLYDAGYRFFCNMDAAEYWVQLRSSYMRQSRRVIDGYRLEYGADLLADLLDAAEVIDENRPRPVPSL